MFSLDHTLRVYECLLVGTDLPSTLLLREQAVAVYAPVKVVIFGLKKGLYFFHEQLRLQFILFVC